MKVTKGGKFLDLDKTGPVRFCGLHLDSRGAFGLWIAPTQISNIVVATTVEIRLAWPPVQCLIGWVGTGT